MCRPGRGRMPGPSLPPVMMVCIGRGLSADAFGGRFLRHGLPGEEIPVDGGA